MKKWLYLILSALVIVLALFLRVSKIQNRAPFDWDQNRDYLAVEQIVSGKFTLIGPVAKGEGGFFLGPLYYYLCVPGFLLSGGAPISLPITSAVLDVLAIVAILVFFPKILGKNQSLLLALLWSVSWFAIEMSKVSWNVALLQIWLVVYIYLLSISLSSFKALLLGIVLGATWHIHAVTIPLSLLIFLIYLKKLHLSWIDLCYVGLGYLIALSPLILFDLRHVGLERNLLIQFLLQSEGSRPPFMDILSSVLARFGKNTVAIVSGHSELSLSWGIVATILSGLSSLRGNRIVKLAGLIVLTNLLLVLYLGEIRFPEYYLASCYLPILIILIDSLTHFKKIRKPLVLISLTLFFLANLGFYSSDKTSFALAQKQDMVNRVAQLGNIVDMRYDLSFGRESGIGVLLQQAGVVSKKSANTQVIITEGTSESVYIDGEIAEDLGWFGGYRLAYRVVQ